MDATEWLILAGALLWLLVIVLVVTAAAMLFKHLRANRGR